MEKYTVIVHKNKEYWTGILLKGKKLRKTSFLETDKNALITYLTSKIDGIYDVEETHHNIIAAINGIIDGTNFDLPTIDFDFSDYSTKEQRVLETLLKIPAGTTISYGNLAKKAGLPNAGRFIGNVMAKNSFAPLIPCHRVVLASGKIGNYSGKDGPKIKQMLLEKEKKNKKSL